MLKLFVGVDGGATKCIVRVESETGKLLGRATDGPANIRISVQQAWQSISNALAQILKPLGLSVASAHCHFQVGMGLAGVEVAEAYQLFKEYPHGFQRLIVTSDSHIACLGAHHGQDGAIIIAGTGTVGYQIQQNRITKVGGWGFPHDDDGGGAWLGMQAVKKTLQWLDGRTSKTPLLEKVYQHFENDLDQLVGWANQANSSQFAEIAPLVIQANKQGDEGAIHLLQHSAQHIEAIADTLLAKQVKPSMPLPCSLLGGIAPFIEVFLSANFRARLRPCLLPADSGAICLLRSGIHA